MFTHLEDQAVLMGSLGKDQESQVGRSCQIASDVEAGIIQMGNHLISTVGCQAFVDLYRDNLRARSLLGNVSGNPWSLRETSGEAEEFEIEVDQDAIESSSQPESGHVQGFIEDGEVENELSGALDLWG